MKEKICLLFLFIIYVFTYDFIFYFVKIIIFHTLLSLYLTTERLKEDEVEEVQCTYNHQNFRLLPLRTAPPTRPSGACRFLLQIDESFVALCCIYGYA